MDTPCKCGRVWHLTDHKNIVRDPGPIICKCGEYLHRWSGSRTWTAELVKGLPGDEKNPEPKYE